MCSPNPKRSTPAAASSRAQECARSAAHSTGFRHRSPGTPGSIRSITSAPNNTAKGEPPHDSDLISTALAPQFQSQPLPVRTKALNLVCNSIMPLSQISGAAIIESTGIPPAPKRSMMIRHTRCASVRNSFRHVIALKRDPSP